MVRMGVAGTRQRIVTPMTRPHKACLQPRWEPPSGVSALARIQRSLLACQRLQSAPQVQREPVQPASEREVNVKPN